MEPISASAALIMGGSSLLGKGLDIGFQWWGMRKQVEENRRAEALGLKIRDEDIFLAQKWKSKEFRLAMQRFGLQEDELELMGDKFEWNKEQAELSREDGLERQNYDRIQSFTNNMTNMMNKNQDFKNNLINVMGARRA